MLTSDRLSPRQRDTLRFIVQFVRKNGYPPSRREIGEGLGIGSTNGVTDHIVALEKKGFIARGASGASRTIRVLQYPPGLLPPVVFDSDDGEDGIDRLIETKQAELEELIALRSARRAAGRAR